MPYSRAVRHAFSISDRPHLSYRYTISSVAIDVTTSRIISVESGAARLHDFPLIQNDLEPRSSQLTLSFTNNYQGSPVFAYLSGRDSAGSIVFLTTNGTWYYPVLSSGAGHQRVDPLAILLPLNEYSPHLDVTIPDSLISGRVWVATGELPFYISTNDGATAMQLIEPSVYNDEDPSAVVSWGFLELTYTEGVDVYANLSFVDFVGFLLGLFLTLADGTVQTVAGPHKDAVSGMCNALRVQATQDNHPWDELCVVDRDSQPIRIVSPSKTANASLLQGYYAHYVDRVWDRYTSQDLFINTQSDAGLVPCRVSEEVLRCQGDNRGYSRPSEADIWGCSSGPFAIAEEDNAIHRAVVPRLCAAFTRSTLLVDGGAVQPSVNSGQYYAESPTNHYSRLVHQFLADGKGYAFPYDDVDVDGANAAGVVSGSNPQRLEIIVGGSLGNQRI
ncbi:glycoside hydrolase family 64 protein [Hypoxylon trugodes]|uniref:glycoside hydrolase family 64 protein n=1 Tax=Hypoxylon trugodes TaxID=326681 RepID=UPI00219CFA7A|nr:glycoside hydrolase family 64 protein [Hypoxylon trugodes]KAI1382497.1 glycoside hydrolase family 64 protein [Hypoxylon trugodes]